jgi:hypothetical protein
MGKKQIFSTVKFCFFTLFYKFKEESKGPGMGDITLLFSGIPSCLLLCLSFLIPQGPQCGVVDEIT